jgi:hypothetical protein
MPDEHPPTSRQPDRLRTDVASVESGLEVIMEQVARLPARKLCATQGDGLEIGTPVKMRGCV